MGLPTGTITAGSIFTFAIWKGQMRPMGPVVDIWQRLGQDGEGAQQLGSTAPPAQITGIILSNSMAALQTIQENVMQLAGLFGDITEPNGASWTNALIVSVDTMITGGIRNFDGTSYEFALECRMAIKAQQ